MKTEAQIKADFLSEERERLIKEKIKHDIDISILEPIDPEVVLAEEVTKDKDGKETVRQVKAKDILANYRQEKQSKEIRLNTVETFIKNKEK